MSEDVWVLLRFEDDASGFRESLPGVPRRDDHVLLADGTETIVSYVVWHVDQPWDVPPVTVYLRPAWTD